MKWFFWVLLLVGSCKTTPDKSWRAATGDNDPVGGWRSCQKDTRQDITTCVLEGDRVRICIRDRCATTPGGAR